MKTIIIIGAATVIIIIIIIVHLCILYIIFHVFVWCKYVLSNTMSYIQVCTYIFVI